MGRWNSDKEWQKAFLDSQAELLANDPREHFDHKAYVELSQENLDLLLWLAENHTSLPTTRWVAAAMKTRLANPPDEAKLNGILRDPPRHLDIVSGFGVIDETAKARWSIVDQNISFSCLFFVSFSKAAVTARLNEITKNVSMIFWALKVVDWKLSLWDGSSAFLEWRMSLPTHGESQIERRPASMIFDQRKNSPRHGCVGSTW